MRILPTYSIYCTIKIFFNHSILLLRDKMSLTLTSARTFAHASTMRGATALLMRVLKLSHTIFHPRSRIDFSTFAQQEAPRTIPARQKFLARQMREQHRIEQMFAWSVVQKELAVAMHKAHKYKRWSGFIRGFNEVFWPVLCGLCFGAIQEVREDFRYSPVDILANFNVLAHSYNSG
jgi:hypothetical protein